MARRIYLKDGGLSTSPTIPPGYTALGSDSGDIKKKVVDTVSNVGGAGSGSYFKYVTTFYTVGDGDTVSILYSDIIAGGLIPDATTLGGTASNDPYIDFNVQVYLPHYTPIGGVGDGIIQTGWSPTILNTETTSSRVGTTISTVNMDIDMSGNISISFDFGDTGVPIPIRVVITA
jgi:hypothetical protein